MSNWYEAPRSLIIIGNIVVCFVMSLIGFWYFVFIPSGVLAFTLKRRWVNLIQFGLSASFGALLSLLVYEPGYRFASASLVASIIGLPGGFAIPLALTLIIIFLISGFAAMITSSLHAAT
ncbi:MAG: hypothetical protein QXG05_00095 [Nitrososphaerota archaeon]